MKYIRTKDGIYERVMVTRQVCDDKEVAVIRPDKVEFEPIIAQADTIEELCDEFVVVVGKETKGYNIFNQCLNSFKKVASFNQKAKDNDAIIYGAIWTDKGLIYVAKMNEKGELELL